MPEAAAIVLAAGAGERLGAGEPKAFVRIGGRPILLRTVERVLAAGVGSLVIVVPEGWDDAARSLLGPLDRCEIVTGASSRHGSVRAGLAAVPEEVAFVLCHDAARPFASLELFETTLGVFEAFPDVDGAVPVIALPDTPKRVRDGLVVGTEDRTALMLSQTPQAFRSVALRHAHAHAAEAGLEFTDDSAVLEWAGYRVMTVAGEAGNFKITTAEDLARAESLAREMARG